MATPITEAFLIDFGFKKIQSLILPSYEINISRHPGTFKTLSCTIQQGNQYVTLREGEKQKDRMNDDLVNVYNSDYDGELTCEYIQALYNLLKPQK